MAKVKIKMGENEVEVDSRDFYVDNQSVGQVIEEVSRHLQLGSVMVYERVGGAVRDAPRPPSAGLEQLKSLDDAEVHEPEFSSPTRISGGEVKSKLKVLGGSSFFDEPKTVCETVAQLREYGWIASPLEVSRTLTRMVFQREMTKDSQYNRSCYAVKESLLAR